MTIPSYKDEKFRPKNIFFFFFIFPFMPHRSIRGRRMSMNHTYEHGHNWSGLPSTVVDLSRVHGPPPKINGTENGQSTMKHRKHTCRGVIFKLRKISHNNRELNLKHLDQWATTLPPSQPEAKMYSTSLLIDYSLRKLSKWLQNNSTDIKVN